MSENTPNFAAPGYQPGAPQSTPPKNGFGVASLVLGIIALALAAVPFLNYAIIAVAVAGLVLGIIGVTRKFRPHTAALVGTILSAVGLILSIILVIVYTAVFVSVSNAVEDSSSAPASSVTSDSPADAPAKAPDKAPGARTVTYDVTGDGTSATSVTYLTFNDGGSAQSQATDAAIPFHKVVPIKDDKLFSSSIFSLVAQAKDGSTISCKITVDGKVIQQETSTGQYSVVTCSGSAG